MANNRNSHFNSGHGLNNIEGPSDAELMDIEAEPASKDYSDASIEAHREAYAKIDPGYARVRESRKRGSGNVGPSGADLTARPSAADIVSDESIAGMGGGNFPQAGKAVSSDFDPADIHRSMRGVGLGSIGSDEGGVSASPFEKFAPRSSDEATARNQGQFLLKLAGRCNHPRCASMRAKGLELIGKPAEGRSFGKGVEATEPAIPSTYEDKTYYPEDPVTGKQNRKNAQTVRTYSVAPEGKAMHASLSNALGQSGAHIIHADDFLEHHHDPEEMIYLAEKGMPWDH